MRTGHCRLLCHRTGGRNAHEGGPPGAPHSATRAPGTMPQSLISQEQIVLHQNTCFCRGRGYKGGGGREVLAGQAAEKEAQTPRSPQRQPRFSFSPRD